MPTLWACLDGNDALVSTVVAPLSPSELQRWLWRGRPAGPRANHHLRFGPMFAIEPYSALTVMSFRLHALSANAGLRFSALAWITIP